MNSQWTSYGLLAYVAKRLKEKGLPLGKTKLQKLIFLLKELKGIDAGYRFHFYTYGPFSNSLAGDIDYLEHIKGLKVLLGESTESFIIEPGETAPIIVEKAREYLEPHKDDIDSVLEQFGGKLARVC